MKRVITFVASIAVVMAVFACVGGAGTAPGSAAGPSSGAVVGPVAEAADETTDEAGDSAAGRAYEQGVILVGLQDGATAADLNARLARLDYIATKQVADDDIERGYVKLELPDGIDVESAEARIASENADIFAFAQPNFRYHILEEAPASAATTEAATSPATASAPAPFIAGIISQATAINDTYQSKQWALEKMNAYDAWDTARAGAVEGKRVTVAVIDNGCQTDHPDLAANIVASYNVVDTADAVRADFDSHGTHVCGIVSAIANNGTGVAGVSYNAGLLPIQAFYETTAFNEKTQKNETIATTDSVKLHSAYVYILKNASAYNIRVVNMSLGGVYSGIDRSDQLLINQVEKAYAAGIVTTCAAGNEAGSTKQDGPYNNFPSDWLDECALGVIATDKNDARGDFSNYNTTGQTTKDLSAPGVAVYSTMASSSYGYLSGTSMAAPCVAGVAALVLTANPDLTAAEVSEVLCKTARDLGDDGWDEEFGWGLVDAKAAVEAAVASADPGEGDGGNGSGGADGDDSDSGDISGSSGDSGSGGSEADDPEGSDSDGKGDSESGSEGGSDGGSDGGNSDDNGDGEGDSENSGDTNSNDRDSENDPVAGDGERDTAEQTDNKNPSPVLKGDNDSVAPPAKTPVVTPAGTKITKLKAGKRSFTVKWRKQGVQTRGYQVQYSLKKSFASKVKTVTVSKVKTTSKKVKKLKARKRYYVRVRTFATVGGVRYYSAWSGAKSVKTK